MGPMSCQALLLWAGGLFGGKHIFDVYRDLSAQFPLPEGNQCICWSKYVAERHELVSDPDIYSNGFKELIAILSANLARKIQ